ncbi:urease accessory protein UreD [Candidatus Contendibacter odensensis]|uniref:Urease accessory protein UreD n=1 Tax=Candidatus Contendobacter odensis Run_B_J11 TaxID=1400861 RepID=A0A7U7GFD4_9GAMM|nr:urease accessory protein UreD [Candidatus Contendobacter odensis]CDH47375.1 putative Urease accessory protein UreD [Candidatus Contendobacter odensis Run_B_J11]
MPLRATVPTPSKGWQACLTLGFQRQGSRTILGSCLHRGPLQVQRPFYPEGEAVCHVAILHPPGGVVGGDELRFNAALDANSHALITTPAAGKFYRSAGPMAYQTQRLTVAAGAVLEWLPQENIVYAGAKIHAITRVELQGDARFIGWEILCLGRPAAGEIFTTGEYRQNFELWRDGEPLYLEHSRYNGGDPVLAARWGLQNQPVSATLLCAGSPPDGVNIIRAGWEELMALLPATGAGELATVTQLDGVLIGRYLGPSAVRARRLFTLAWEVLRPAILNRPACPSRFWNT